MAGCSRAPRDGLGDSPLPTRWLLATALALLTGGLHPRLAADDPPPADKKVAESFVAAKKDFEKNADDLVRRIKKAQTVTDRDKLKAQLRELEDKFLARLVGLAEKHPDAEPTFHLLTELVELGGDYGKRA